MFSGPPRGFDHRSGATSFSRSSRNPGGNSGSRRSALLAIGWLFAVNQSTTRFTRRWSWAGVILAAFNAVAMTVALHWWDYQRTRAARREQPRSVDHRLCCIARHSADERTLCDGFLVSRTNRRKVLRNSPNRSTHLRLLTGNRIPQMF